MKKRDWMSNRKNLISLTIALVSFLVILVVLITWFGRKMYLEEVLLPEAPETTGAEEEVTAEAEVTETLEPTAEPTEAPVQENAFIKQLQALHEENPEMWGWITIDGTALDDSLMYTPDDPEKYLHLDFTGTYSVYGLPFLDSDCSLNPESDNLIIYGHNMKDGSRFRTIMAYEDESHWEAHPVIRLFTLEEEREYEVLAAFYDRVYYKYEECFKFYQFIDAEDEAAYNEAITYYKEHSVYDTGVTAQYGDRLITLVTCSSHEENGRFVVVAREVTNEDN